MHDETRDYRGQLIALEQKAQEAYDKTILSLSGGALGVSFAFVTGFVKSGSMQASGFLVAAWISWALSVTTMLGSHFTSSLALRRAIRDFDSDNSVAQPGRRYDLVTAILNAGAGVLFLVGVLCIAAFVWRNV